MGTAAERKHKLPDAGVFHNRFILKKQLNRQERQVLKGKTSGGVVQKVKVHYARHIWLSQLLPENMVEILKSLFLASLASLAV